MENAITEHSQNQISPFSTKQAFTDAWQMADCLSRSSVVPAQYQGKDNIPNCIIALELAHRLKISPFLVMQNTYVIQGRPSWSSQYLIGSINISGKFSPLRWKISKGGKIKAEYKVADGWDSVNKKKKYKTLVKEVENYSCIAFATEISTGEILEGPEINIAMAIAEGWYGKDGSKWQTMPELMLRYRAAAFFCRMYCPEFAMGLHTTEEIEDIAVRETVPVVKTAQARAEDLTEKLLNEPDEDAPVAEVEFIPPVAEAKQAEPVVENDQQSEEIPPQEFEDVPPDDAFEAPCNDGGLLF